MSRLMVYYMRHDWDMIVRCFAEHTVKNWHMTRGDGDRKMYVELEDAPPGGAGTPAVTLEHIAEQQRIQTGILGEILEAVKGLERGRSDGDGLSWPPRQVGR